MPLIAPERSFSKGPLLTTAVAASQLTRISRHKTGEPFFGRSGANRFDDFRYKRSHAKRFGTCYCGLALSVAFAESVLHDEYPVAGKFQVAEATLDTRYVINMKGSSLLLADLTGEALKRSGIDSSISTVTPYDLPQQWAVAIHKHPTCVDGILYMSRHMNTHSAVVLFDRAAPKIQAGRPQVLRNYPGAMAVILNFGVTFY